MNIMVIVWLLFVFFFLETWWPWCDYWKDPQHIIFHLANLCFLIGYASKTTPKGVLFMHTCVIIGKFDFLFSLLISHNNY